MGRRGRSDWLESLKLLQHKGPDKDLPPLLGAAGVWGGRGGVTVGVAAAGARVRRRTHAVSHSQIGAALHPRAHGDKAPSSPSHATPTPSHRPPQASDTFTQSHTRPLTPRPHPDLSL